MDILRYLDTTKYSIERTWIAFSCGGGGGCSGVGGGGGGGGGSGGGGGGGGSSSKNAKLTSPEVMTDF